MSHGVPGVIVGGEASASGLSETLRGWPPSRQRSYTKGRDLYDLIWYLSDPEWPPPNLLLLKCGAQPDRLEWWGGWLAASSEVPVRPYRRAALSCMIAGSMALGRRRLTAAGESKSKCG